MARLTLFAALAVGAAVAFGCGPAKELPDEIPKSPEPAEHPSSAAPKSSDPAAKAYVEKVVKAYTGGKPELLEKGKASRLVLRGKVLIPGTQRALGDATRTVAAVWPGRLHDVDEIQSGNVKIAPEVWYHSPRMWINVQSVENISNSPKERSIAADMTAQHWMMLLLPLTDPKTVVFDLKPQTIAGAAGQPQAVQTLKLALGELPHYDLTFDAATHALVRVEYQLPEVSLPVRRSWTMLEHKVGPSGLNLPSKMQLRWNGDLKEDWQEAKWEFPESIPDTEFSPPQK